MIAIPEEVLTAAAQDALRDLSRHRYDPSALDTLIASDVLVPLPADIAMRDAQDTGAMTLPVLEYPPGTQAVVVFTCEERLSDAFPEIQCYRQLQLEVLAANWPTDTDLILAIDLGHTDSITFTSAAVRSLLSHCQR
ncbi:SseB family protein [Streptomyces sp. HC44]|uniref:SseB family protein n=1 Tax=Streptomyces scabichelini TaxID=2711217 RepID=A0A6G4V612_9ACTN|nr:SseB family protein [Streptomyces scabichelini]NGO09355.1 SseB family protein [Streptomyces scabichelini]